MDSQILNTFLKVPTPATWLQFAAQNIPLLLLDHAHCERKAAANAINFISRYPEKDELVKVMAPLAREELLHFEKVNELLQQMGITFGPLPPSNYGATLHKLATNKNNEQRLRDLLIIGAIIEARSCERFNALIPFLEDSALAKFYGLLVRSEGRHFEDYLRLARLYGGVIDERVTAFLAVENEFIQAQDKVFRFHSGVPVPDSIG